MGQFKQLYLVITSAYFLNNQQTMSFEMYVLIYRFQQGISAEEH